MPDHPVSFVANYWALILLTLGLFGLRFVVQRTNRVSGAVMTEALTVYAAYLFYFMVRGLVKDQRELAFTNARRIVELEQWMGLHIEEGLQAAVIDQDQIVSFMNWIYVWAHWPVIAGALIWLFIKVPERYQLYRNAFLISGAIGLLFFALFPTAPPRFLPELSLTDTVTQRSYSHHVLLPPDLANKYAAVPSLHAGWNLLVGIAIVREARHWGVKVLGAIMPAFMLASIVLTGNHFIIDGFIGYAVVIAGLMLATVYTNARRQDAEPEPQPQIVAPG